MLVVIVTLGKSLKHYLYPLEGFCIIDLTVSGGVELKGFILTLYLIITALFN